MNSDLPLDRSTIFLSGFAPKRLKEKLRSEAPGILAWIIEGCREWQQIGLQPPSDVESATKEYLSRADDVRVFIDDEYVREKGSEVYTDDLHQRWVIWCERNARAPGARRGFTERIQVMFCTEPGHANKLKVIGLRPRNPDSPAIDPTTLSDPQGRQPEFVH
jgi:putative DNA primase/helicase